MWSTFGQILPMAAAVGLSPIPILAVVLMLLTPRARSNALTFLAGWVGGLLVLEFAVALLAGWLDVPSDDTSTQWGRIVVGVLFLALAVRKWRRRPPGGAAAEPAWMAKLDTFSPGRAASLAVVLSVLNPKNLLLALSASLTVASADLDSGEQSLLLVLFVLVASIGVVVPIVVYFALGSRGDDVMRDWRTWIVANNTGVTIALLVVIGAMFIGQGLG